MDIQSYIASGILESYVLGITSLEENTEIEQLAIQYPQIKAELEAIRSSLEAYIMQHEQMPSSALKKKIWHKLEQSNEDETDTIVPKEVTSFSNESAERVKPLGVQPWQKYLVAASIAGLILSLVANMFLYNQLQNTKLQLAEANTINQQIAQELQINQVKYNTASQELAVLTNPANKIINLVGLKPAPDAVVVVYWDSKQKEVHIDIQNLPAPASDKQYQLWAIVDGKPINAGMLATDINSQNLQKMKNIERADAFAITLEKKGGNATPQGEMYVLGEMPKKG